MRKTWMAIAVIVSLVVIAASYRIGRSGKPQTEAVSPEQPPAQATDAAPPEAAPIVPQPRPGDEAASPPPSAGEVVDEAAVPTIPSARTAAQVPAVVEPAPSPDTSVPGAKAQAQATLPTPSSSPKTIPPPTPPAAQPPTPTPSGAPTTEDPTKEAETAPPPDDPESDRRPPVLQNLRFDPPEVKDGSTTMLYVGSSDELSGVKSVYGAVRSPSGSALVPFSARDMSGGVFAATIAIPARGETGDWFVANLHIVDKAENNLTLAFARATVPQGGALRVVSDESDSQAPDVRRVSVVRASVDAGERNQIVVEVEDVPSGVALVSGAFQSPSKSAFIPFNCAHIGDSPSWEGEIAIPENADCGEWTLRQLRVVDKANNSAFLSMDSPQVGRVSFFVAGGGDCDAEPPVVDAMYFQPTVVSNETAAEIVVTVQAHDDRSGVANLSGWIDGPVATNGQAPRIYFECRADPNDNGAPMTARITVPQYAAQGTWRVTLAQVTDKARNTRAYNRNDPALAEASFTVD